MNTSIFHNWRPAKNATASIEHDSKTGLEMVHIKTLPALFQAIGYAKFKKRMEFPIYYRGQTELYVGTDAQGQYLFQPSALRKRKNEDAIIRARRKIQACVDAVRTLGDDFHDPTQYPNKLIEALLQQYGMSSTWIDVVDNIWIALWFACYRADFTVSFGVSETPKTRRSAPKRSFIHMVRRCSRKEDKAKRYAYILLLAGKSFVAENSSKKDKIGMEGKAGGAVDSAKKDKVEMIDLRKELPSTFIRPHVQHGLLVRSSNCANMASLIQGIIRIDLEDALEWLGEGRILLPESIFPPPNYDTGFKWLLENEMQIMGACESCFPIYC